MSRLRKSLVGIPFHLFTLACCASAAHALWLANERAFARDFKAAAWDMVEFPNFIRPSLIAFGFIIALAGPPQTGLETWDRLIRSRALRFMTAFLLVAVGAVLCADLRYGLPTLPAVFASIPTIAVLVGAGLWLAFAPSRRGGVPVVPHLGVDGVAAAPAKPHVTSFRRVMITLAIVAGLILLSVVGVIVIALVGLSHARI